MAQPLVIGGRRQVVIPEVADYASGAVALAAAIHFHPGPLTVAFEASDPGFVEP